MIMAKYSFIGKFYSTFLLSILLSFTTPSKAEAQVFINGYLYQGQELAQLEYLIGPVAPGRYWLNTYTGDWGYEGNSQVQGNLLQQNNAAPDSYGDNRQPYYDSSYGGSSYTPDPETGCSYISAGGMTINTCDNW